MATLNKPVSNSNGSRLSNEILNMLNERIKGEYEAANLYFAAGQWCEENGFLGTAKLLKKHYKEEHEHAAKLYQYIADRNAKTITPDIKAPIQSFIDLMDVMQEAYMHEKKVTDNYNKLAQICLDSGDFVTFNFIAWFLTEQIEEEATFKNYIDQLKIIGDDKGGLFMFDNEIGN